MTRFYFSCGFFTGGMICGHIEAANSMQALLQLFAGNPSVRGISLWKSEEDAESGDTVMLGSYSSVHDMTEERSEPGEWKYGLYYVDGKAVPLHPPEFVVFDDGILKILTGSAPRVPAFSFVFKNYTVAVARVFFLCVFLFQFLS